MLINPAETKYLNVMQAIAAELAGKENKHNKAKVRIPRDDLQSLYMYIAGGKQQPPAKFTQMLKHENVHIKKLRVNGTPTTGLEVEFNFTHEQLISVNQALEGGTNPLTQAYSQVAK